MTARKRRTKSVPKLNAEWHAKHRMPRNATPGQRLAWHLEHQKHCACRPLPAAMRAKLQRGVRSRRAR
jgi:hypothetical protein